jgi:hypothetical protein
MAGAYLLLGHRDLVRDYFAFVKASQRAEDENIPFAIFPGDAPPGAMDEAAERTHYDDFSGPAIVDSPATSLARQSLQSGVQIAVVATAPPQSAPVLLGPQPPPSRVEHHQAVRVAVMTGDASKRQLSVRVLSEGEPAPPGSTEALLVALDPRRRLLV